MFAPEVLTQFRSALVSQAGGYLRNPIREPLVTCSVCTTPVERYSRCYACNRHRAYAGLADAVAPLTYAMAGTQSGYLMRGYKGQPPIAEHVQIVALLGLLALSKHADCAARLAETPITHWSVVPSLPAKDEEHPLRRLVANVAPGVEIPLTAASNAAHPRGLGTDHYTATSTLQDGSHVLLLDDTWASGGHAQSAVLALRAAGAARVSVLVIARWINADFGGNATFIRDRLVRDYDPDQCPWTGDECP